MSTIGNPQKRNEKVSGPIEALTILLEENEMTQKRLAEIIGMSEKTLSSYMTRRTEPDWLFVSDVATCFGVSADWLMGLSEVRAPKINPQAIHKIHNETGLSVSAIEILHQHSGNVLYAKGVSYLIEESEALEALIAYIWAAKLGELYEKYALIPKKYDSAKDATSHRQRNFNQSLLKLRKNMGNQSNKNDAVLPLLLREYMDEAACFEYWIKFGFRASDCSQGSREAAGIEGAESLFERLFSPEEQEEALKMFAEQPEDEVSELLEQGEAQGRVLDREYEIFKAIQKYLPELIVKFEAENP